MSTESPACLPAIVSSDFLGADKTSVRSHVLSSRSGKKVAVVVSDMSEINTYCTIVLNEVTLTRSEEKLVEMSRGCTCRRLRDVPLEEETELTGDGRLDYLLIDSTGIAEPLSVAETFTLA